MNSRILLLVIGILLSPLHEAIAETARTSPKLTQAWQDYYQTLDEMRILMEATPRFQNNPQDRAKAYHTLMEMQAMAYNFAVAPRMSHPRVNVHTGWQTDLFTLGQNGQDFYYAVVFLDGRQRYRMTGEMGDIKLFLLQMFNGLFDKDTVKSIGNYDWNNFDINDDGSFEVILSASEEKGNWIKLDPDVDYQFMLVRRALVDWQADPGNLRVERISEIPENYYDYDEFDEDAMANRIRRATGFVKYLVNNFNIALYDTYLANAGETNRLTLLPGTTTSEIGNPVSNYAMAIFDLDPDEALIMHMDKAPDGAYWSFQLGDVWSRALDFTNHLTSINMREVAVDEDGGITIVVSDKDPGVKNWLDTTGRKQGTIVFRNYRATSRPVPVTRKVMFAELNNHLPADTVRVTEEERTKAIEYRREGLRRLYD
jgi:Protein of unknown function (DUF1214)